MNIRNLIIFSSIALGLFCSCDRESDIGNYQLKIKSEIADSDSVKVLVYDSDYNHLRTLNAGKLKNGTLTLSGEMQQQTIAMLDYGKKEPITFILEKCETEITIGKDNVIIWGGKVNHEYLSKCKNIYMLEKEIKNIESGYRKALADSSLNPAKEKKLLQIHKTLSDSLQHTILQAINGNDEVGQLIKEKFFNRLDTTSLKQIK